MSDSATSPGGAASAGPPPPPPPTGPSSAQAPSAKEVAASATSFLRSFGVRAERRGTPRFAVLLGVAGALVASLGPVFSTGEESLETGLVIAIYVVLLGVGFALVWLFRDGVLATAGATASGIALFNLLGELLNSDVTTNELELTSVIILSSIGWVAMYLVGPGRGHTVYAGLMSISVALLLVSLISEDTQSFLTPGLSTIWGFILVGALWAALGLLLDRLGLGGLAVAFLGTGVALLAYGAVSMVSLTSGLSNNLFGGTGGFAELPEPTDLLLPGVAAIAIGIAAMRFGVGAQRRATAWTGCAVLATGLWALLFGLTGTNLTVAAILMVLAGAGVVYGAHELGRRLGEPNELSEADSFADGGILVALRTFAPASTTASATWGADESQGPGWWVASDGKWYPPTDPVEQPRPAAPEPTASAPAEPEASTEAAAPTPPPSAAAPLDDLPPAPGWWKASDGKWYPPQS